jgi:Zn-finger nucleic acid-binding protein
MSYPTDSQPQPGVLRCPKCAGTMRTYERNGVHLEQCESCRGIFLDFGELEALTQLEARMVQQQAPPPHQQAPYQQAPYQQAPSPAPYGPAWGHQGGQHYRRGGFGRLFFSS